MSLFTRVLSICPWKRVSRSASTSIVGQSESLNYGSLDQASKSEESPSQNSSPFSDCLSKTSACWRSWQTQTVFNLAVLGTASYLLASALEGKQCTEETKNNYPCDSVMPGWEIQLRLIASLITYGVDIIYIAYSCCLQEQEQEEVLISYT